MAIKTKIISYFNSTNSYRHPGRVLFFNQGIRACPTRDPELKRCQWPKKDLNGLKLQLQTILRNFENIDPSLPKFRVALLRKEPAERPPIKVDPQKREISVFISLYAKTSPAALSAVVYERLCRQLVEIMLTKNLEILPANNLERIERSHRVLSAFLWDQKNIYLDEKSAKQFLERMAKGFGLEAAKRKISYELMRPYRQPQYCLDLEIQKTAADYLNILKEPREVRTGIWEIVSHLAMLAAIAASQGHLELAFECNNLLSIENTFGQELALHELLELQGASQDTSHIDPKGNFQLSPFATAHLRLLFGIMQALFEFHYENFTVTKTIPQTS